MATDDDDDDADDDDDDDDADDDDGILDPGEGCRQRGRLVVEHRFAVAISKSSPR